MATIGLYDIDLWHRGKSAPNLELMKIYNYYQQRNNLVRMMKPNEDEGRYSRIIYFKDNPNIQIPRALTINGDKKETYGYGFYKKYYPLDEEIMKVPPVYDLYDVYSYKLSVPNNSYDSLKRDSLIRLESNDFTDFKPERLKMNFVDHDFLYVKDAFECLLENKNHRFNFFHTLWVKDEDTFYKFERFIPLIYSYIIIDFKYSQEFFFENFIKDNVIFKFEKRENETVLNYQLRYVKMGLLYKNKKIRMKIPFNPPAQNDLDKDIIEWLKGPSYESFSDSYKIPSGVSSELRILLKQSPKTINSSSLDFYKNL